jgi:hypothetical protein
MGLNDILTSWGNWHARHWDYQGYPTRSIFASLTDPHYFYPRHKVLCLDAPEYVWPVDRAVARIARPYREALIVRYCMPPHEGRLLSERECARILKISRGGFRHRLYRARHCLSAQNLLEVG